MSAFFLSIGTTGLLVHHLFFCSTKQILKLLMLSVIPTSQDDTCLVVILEYLSLPRESRNILRH
jgi:hypothetical protein